MTTKSPRGFRYVWAKWSYKKRVADGFAFRRKGGKLYLQLQREKSRP